MSFGHGMGPTLEPVVREQDSPEPSLVCPPPPLPTTLFLFKALSSRSFCDDENIPYVFFPIWQLLATCGYYVHEMSVISVPVELIYKFYLTSLKIK